MKIRQLVIKNFRGIKNLVWNLQSSIVCLIGPGDSSKSTILEAISWVLSPKWNLQVNDLDFFQTSVTEPIEISVFVTGSLKKLLDEEKFGLFTCFWNKIEGIHAEQKDGDENTLNIVFRVDDTLEPVWVVRSFDTENEKSISSRDRESIGMLEIGSYFSRDFSWGPISALTKLTGSSNTTTIPAILADVSRVARAGLDTSKLPQLSAAVKQVEQASSSFGYKPKTGFTPGIDPIGVSLNSGSVTLLDGDIPIKVAGLGSRRAVAMAMYNELAKEGAIILVDEIETGLEPYRLRNILRLLRKHSAIDSQVIITTHSEIPLVELNAEEIFVVKNNSGEVSVKQVHNSLQSTLRGMPEAFLARSIVVGEGKTEWGICRALEDYWSKCHGEDLPLAYMGVEPVYHLSSGGSDAKNHARRLSSYGYRVCYFGDSDEFSDSDEEALIIAGVNTLVWPGKMNTEQRICLDLPNEGLQKFIELAIELGQDQDSILDAICSEKKNLFVEIREINDIYKNLDDDSLRKVIGTKASKKSWFKKDERSIALGRLLCDYLEQMAGKPFSEKFIALYEWCYEQFN